MFRLIDRILTQWLQLFLLVGGLWLAVTVLEWIERHWVGLVSGVVLFVLLCAATAFVRGLPVRLQVRRIRRTIARTPRLPRYAWSSEPAELIRQWKTWQAEGRTPRRKRGQVHFQQRK